MKIRTGLKLAIIFSPLFLISACGKMPNGGKLEVFNTPAVEADWIRNGEPIEYNNKLWDPKDNVENLLDAEVFLMGEYRGVQFFVEKTDVKPYDRLYTKFDRNRYRYFESRAE